MEQIVYCMANTETNSFLDRWLCLKSIDIREPKVHQETQNIAKSICKRDIDPLLQHKVYAIMHQSGQGSHHAKSEDFFYSSIHLKPQLFTPANLHFLLKLLLGHRLSMY